MPDFSTDHHPKYGVAEQVSPLIKRITCNNADKFTFKGTGTYIIGTKSVAVIDPGPLDTDHIDALCLELEGTEVSHILITHTHNDHSPASKILKERVGGVLCGFGPHPKDNSVKDNTNGSSTNSEESGDVDFMPDQFLSHKEIINGDGWTIESLHTPGHISNHLCFALKEENSMFTGDHIMGWSTTIIPPPNGNLEDYFNSLKLLLERDETTYWPTHGGPINNPIKFVQELIAHRENRNIQIIDCLKNTRKKKLPISKIVKNVYKGYPKELRKPAARSVLAHLIYLNQKNLVNCDETPQADSKFWIK